MTSVTGPGNTHYRHYVLGMLTLTLTINYMDRGLVALVLQSIQQELSLSDTQLGFLTGIAFGLFYAVLGVPIARWADRGNRVTLTSVAIGLWGLTSMTCLFVTNFIQLVFARIAAAVGEAGGLPPTYSLVGDYFPRTAERVRAMTIYMLSGPCAALLSFMVGGWLNEHVGWRLALFWMGVPAIILAVIIRLTVREPRKAIQSTGAREKPLPSFRDVLNFLWRQRAAKHLCVALILLMTLGYGMAPWYAVFLMRIHGLGTTELGIWLGLIFGLAGIGGLLAGGEVVSRWFSGSDRGHVTWRFS